MNEINVYLGRRGEGGGRGDGRRQEREGSSIERNIFHAHTLWFFNDQPIFQCRNSSTLTDTKRKEPIFQPRTPSPLYLPTKADVASCNNARDQNLEAEVSLAVSFAVCNHQKLEARKPQNEAK